MKYLGVICPIFTAFWMCFDCYPAKPSLEPYKEFFIFVLMLTAIICLFLLNFGERRNE